MKQINLNDDNLKTQLLGLKSGERVLLTGTIYTARDAAHKRLKTMLDQNEKLPVDFSGSMIYYAGPTDKPNNAAVGSIGPTTSARMDSYAEYMKTLKVCAVIGKGERSEKTRLQFLSDCIVYFIATGGCGALLSSRVENCEVVAFDDLGCESIKKLSVRDFPVTVAYDCQGGNIFNG